LSRIWLPFDKTGHQFIGFVLVSDLKKLPASRGEMEQFQRWKKLHIIAGFECKILA
jgi:hypothetical protein